MARYLAFDWDRAEARIILARTQANALQVDAMYSAPLELDPHENNLAGLGRELKQALDLQKLPRCQALTAIGRSQVELRMLKLPPAPAEELPAMVRFQAMREFSALSEDSPLDFLPLGDAAKEPGEVMAASISTELSEQLRGALTNSGLEPLRAALRPCAATSLAMRRCSRAAQGVTMVIAQQADSAELAISKDGMVVFTRSFRLPQDWHPGETGEPLLGEVRRSIAAAQNQLGGSLVEHIVVFGTPDEHEILCERLRKRTDLDVELIDPFAGVVVRGDLPAQPERFAALLGMLHDEADELRPAIDFLNPRKKPKAESNRSLQVLVAATAATAVLAIAAFIYAQFHQRDQRIAKLLETKKENEAAYEQLKSDVELVKRLDAWKEADRDWLDLIYHLSSVQDLTPDDFRVDRLSLTSLQNRPGTAQIFGRAKDDAAASLLLDRLATDEYSVTPRRTVESREDERYPRSFSAIIETNRSIPLITVDHSKTPPTESPATPVEETMEESEPSNTVPVDTASTGEPNEASS